MSKRKKKWIQEAIKHPGALTRLAKREGAITKKGTIKVSWLREQAKRNDTIGRRARLALTLRKLNKRRIRRKK
ncbi:MAG: hypothetical protein ABIL50_05670 [candidate division WOR-3 bacterium]